jgi:TolA-binding protein
MQHFRTLRPALAGAALVLAAGLGACAPAFRLKDYQGSDTRLFQAALQEYRKGHHENAIAAFERLTLDLPARDTLLPRAHFFLGKSHYRRREFILAAQSFSRVAESFPTDTLADDALLWTARSYRRLWRKPTLDAQYGHEPPIDRAVRLGPIPTPNARGRLTT